MGVRREPHEALGTRDLCRIVFDGSVVGDVDVAVLEGEVDAELAWVHDVAAAIEAVEAVGGAEAVLDRTVDYITNRFQFGRPIGSFQAPQHHVANLSIAIDEARFAAYEALWALDTGREVGLSAATARAFGAQTFKNATLHAHRFTAAWA